MSPTKSLSITPEMPSPVKKALANQKKARKRAQANVGEVLTEEACIERLRLEEQERQSGKGKSKGKGKGKGKGKNAKGTEEGMDEPRDSGNKKKGKNAKAAEEGKNKKKAKGRGMKKKEDKKDESQETDSDRLK